MVFFLRSILRSMSKRNAKQDVCTCSRRVHAHSNIHIRYVVTATDTTAVPPPDMRDDVQRGRRYYTGGEGPGGTHARGRKIRFLKPEGLKSVRHGYTHMGGKVEYATAPSCCSPHLTISYAPSHKNCCGATVRRGVGLFRGAIFFTHPVIKQNYGAPLSELFCGSIRTAHPSHRLSPPAAFDIFRV